MELAAPQRERGENTERTHTRIGSRNDNDDEMLVLMMDAIYRGASPAVCLHVSVPMLYSKALNPVLETDLKEQKVLKRYM